ncbi:MAG: TonB-dependent Receptor Plug Domain, partial [Halomonas sp. HL-93]
MRMHSKKHSALWSTLSFVSLVATSQVHAQQASTNAESESLSEESEAMVVTATRSRSDEGETPQRVTVIDREQIEQQMAITEDPGQVLSNLIPSYSPSRQKLSNAGETFRGRDAAFLVDGVPQSNPLRDSSR